MCIRVPRRERSGERMKSIRQHDGAGTQRRQKNPVVPPGRKKVRGDISARESQPRAASFLARVHSMSRHHQIRTPQPARPARQSLRFQPLLRRGDLRRPSRTHPPFKWTTRCRLISLGSNPNGVRQKKYCDEVLRLPKPSSTDSRRGRGAGVPRGIATGCVLFFRVRGGMVPLRSWTRGEKR